MSNLDYKFGWIVFMGTLLFLFSGSNGISLGFYLICLVYWGFERVMRIDNKIKNYLGYVGLIGVAIGLVFRDHLGNASVVLTLIGAVLFVKAYLQKDSNKRSITTPWYYLILIGVVFAAAYLRLIGYDCLPAYRDEEHHIRAVFEYLERGKSYYTRSPLTSFLGRIGRDLRVDSYLEILYGGRLTAVISGILTTIPIFLLGRRIGLITGVLAAGLWALSPWAVSLSQIFREYSHYTFLCVIGLLCCAYLFDSGFQDLKPRKVIKQILSLLVLLGMTYFIAIKDAYSSFKIVPFIWFVYGASRLMLSVKSRRELLIAVAILLALGTVLLFKVDYVMHFLALKIEINSKWYDTFFLTTQSTRVPFHWWTRNGMASVIPFVLLIFGLAYAFKENKKKEFFPILFAFCFFLVAFALFFLRYYSAKYMFYLLPLFCILIGAGLQSILQFIKKDVARNERAFLPIALVIFLLFFIPRQSVYALLEPSVDEKQFNPISGVLHLDKYPVVNYINENVPASRYSEMVIFTNFYSELIRMELPAFRAIVKYDHANPNRFKHLIGRLNNYSSGLFVIDQKRNTGYRKNLPARIGKPFALANFTFELVYDDKVNHIYTWHRTGPGERTPKTFNHEKLLERERLRKNDKLNKIDSLKSERGWLGKYSEEFVF